MWTLLSWLGEGGVPFLLPLLYQVGPGYTPVQSGLLITRQFLAAISLEFFAVVGKATFPRWRR